MNVNHRRHFVRESSRDINRAEADEIFRLEPKHQHRKGSVSNVR